MCWCVSVTCFILYGKVLEMEENYTINIIDVHVVHVDPDIHDAHQLYHVHHIHHVHHVRFIVGSVHVLYTIYTIHPHQPPHHQPHHAIFPVQNALPQFHHVHHRASIDPDHASTLANIKIIHQFHHDHQPPPHVALGPLDHHAHPDPLDASDQYCVNEVSALDGIIIRCIAIGRVNNLLYSDHCVCVTDDHHAHHSWAP